MKHRPRLLITAGPTHEPIDRVRYVANRSSGRMGRALAKAAHAKGLPATLLLGPIETDLPDQYSSVAVQRFRTTADLEALLSVEWPLHDVLLMAAAVADYRPRIAAADGKIRRADHPLTLVLDPTPDLLAACSALSRRDQVAIGFALEPSETLLEPARSKLGRKGVDAIVANPLETMGSDHIAGMLLTPHTVRSPTPKPGEPVLKEVFASWLLDQAVELWTSKQSP